LKRQRILGLKLTDDAGSLRSANSAVCYPAGILLCGDQSLQRGSAAAAWERPVAEGGAARQRRQEL